MRFTRYTYQELIGYYTPNLSDILLEKFPTVEKFIEAYGRDFLGFRNVGIPIAELYAVVDCIFDKLKYNISLDIEEWVVENRTCYFDYIDTDSYYEVSRYYDGFYSYVEAELKKYYTGLKKLYKQILKYKIVEQIKIILKDAIDPIPSNVIADKVQGMYPDINDFLVKNILTTNSKFVLVGRKGYILKKNRAKVYTLYETIFRILEGAGKPLSIQEVIDNVLIIRPDSNSKSIRTIITTLVQNNELSYYTNHHTIGLYDASVYDNKYEKYIYEFKRRSVEEGLEELRDYLDTYGHLPFAEDEISGDLYVWYYRVKQSTTITPQEMTLLYQFDQMLEKEYIPKNKTEYIFRENAENYISYIHRNGRLVSSSDNEKLYRWFYKSKNRTDQFTEFERFHYDRILETLDAFQLREITDHVVTEESQPDSMRIYDSSTIFIGSLVKVLAGPFIGFEGIVDKILDNQQLIVKVTIFDRIVPLTLNYNDVQKC